MPKLPSKSTINKQMIKMFNIFITKRTRRIHSSKSQKFFPSVKSLL